jgi:hypothetical protein
MSPTNPHTATDEPRSCESCHASEKALGYGINGGRDTRRPDRAVIVDLETVDGHILAENARTQMEPIEGLEADWSRFVTEDGRQLQTVGHHFSGSRPLNDRERAAIDREGACLACHQEIPEENLAVSFLHHVAEYTGQIPESADEHNDLVHKIVLVAAWGQFLGVIIAPIAAIFGTILVVRWWRRRREADY